LINKQLGLLFDTRLFIKQVMISKIIAKRAVMRYVTQRFVAAIILSLCTNSQVESHSKQHPLESSSQRLVSTPAAHL